MPWFFFCTTREELYLALSQVELPSECAVLLSGNRRAPAAKHWQSAVLDPETIQLRLRQKTDLSPLEVVDELFGFGRYHGGMHIHLGAMDRENSRLQSSAMAYDDKAREPGYPLAEPLFKAIRKEIRKFARIRLVTDDEEFRTPVFASEGFISVRQEMECPITSSFGNVPLFEPGSKP